MTCYFSLLQDEKKLVAITFWHNILFLYLDCVQFATDVSEIFAQDWIWYSFGSLSWEKLERKQKREKHLHFTDPISATPWPSQTYPTSSSYREQYFTCVFCIYPVIPRSSSVCHNREYEAILQHVCNSAMCPFWTFYADFVSSPGLLMNRNRPKADAHLWFSLPGSELLTTVLWVVL